MLFSTLIRSLQEAMKEAMAAVKREQVAAQLHNQSLLLQSHPFVTTAVLLGKGYLFFLFLLLSHPFVTTAIFIGEDCLFFLFLFLQSRSFKIVVIWLLIPPLLHPLSSSLLIFPL